MTIKGLYPLSTQDGKAIPLDVVKPSTLVKADFVAATPLSVTIPADTAICYLFATKACVLRMAAVALPAVLVSGTEYANAIFIPENMPMTLLLEAGEAYVLGEESGSIYISAVEQWGALLQQRQASVG